MLIARLVRRPPATSARSSARGRLAGSLRLTAVDVELSQKTRYPSVAKARSHTPLKLSSILQHLHTTSIQRNSSVKLFASRSEIIDFTMVIRGTHGTVDDVFRFAFPPVPLDDHKSIGNPAS
ncbi:hypothetical protein CAJAP_02799 [Camponotus japonicus]